MEPSTAAAGAAVVGCIMGYNGNMAAAKNAQAVADYNAEVAENEAVLLARAKRDQEEGLRKQSDRLEGAQRAAISKSGVQIKGSALQTLADTYFNTEMDALRIQYASDVQQTAAQASATLARTEGSARASGLKTQAYQSLLSGGSKAATLMG